MPVARGRNLSILVEIAARNHVLKMQGHFSAHEFARQLEEQLERKRGSEAGGGGREEGSDGAGPGLELVIVTGLSGSGKSTVAKCFEDLGYYVRRQPAAAAAARVPRRPARAGRRRPAQASR